MITLKTFLAELATDPKKFRDFIDRPESALKEVEMSEEEKNLIINGDLPAIKERLNEADKSNEIHANREA